MKDLPPGIKRSTVGGRTYYYRRVGNGLIPLPPPDDPSFQVAYERASVAAAAATKGKRVAEGPFLWEWTRFKATLMECLRRSRERGHEFDIDLDYVADLVSQNGGRCALSGLLFDLKREGGKRNPFRPSIDRIDSSRGYVRGNVRVVLAAVNNALSDYGDDVYLEICRAVARRNVANPFAKSGRQNEEPLDETG
ncbi:hypothetical protein [Thauera sp.]|uniref:hypothetical protein n=1 Tax=Thauera sp. TaxID=1905334 RepID=UPI002B82FE4D|nr:hypothetical protein [Thauera sp.]HRP26364.1 hypothetical protein [Thauera sp.]